MLWCKSVHLLQNKRNLIQLLLLPYTHRISLLVHILNKKKIIYIHACAYTHTLETEPNKDSLPFLRYLSQHYKIQTLWARTLLELSFYMFVLHSLTYSFSQYVKPSCPLHRQMTNSITLCADRPAVCCFLAWLERVSYKCLSLLVFVLCPANSFHKT